MKKTELNKIRERNKKILDADVYTDYCNFLNDVDDSINKMTEQMDALLALDFSKPLTEFEWYKICETPLKQVKSLMKVLVQQIFPNAEDINVESNYVKFTLYGFECKLPTYRNFSIEVDASWYIPDFGFKDLCVENFMSKYEITMLNYFIAVDDDADWQTLFNISHPTYYKWSKLRKWFAWNTRFKRNIISREDFDAKYEERVKVFEEKRKEDMQTRQKMKSNVEQLQIKLVPELLRFTKQVTTNSTHMFNWNGDIDTIIKAEFPDKLVRQYPCQKVSCIYNSGSDCTCCDDNCDNEHSDRCTLYIPKIEEENAKIYQNNQYDIRLLTCENCLARGVSGSCYLENTNSTNLKATCREIWNDSVKHCQ